MNEPLDPLFSEPTLSVAFIQVRPISHDGAMALSEDDGPRAYTVNVKHETRDE